LAQRVDISPEWGATGDPSEDTARCVVDLREQGIGLRKR
jgi:hypothetical protein